MDNQTTSLLKELSDFFCEKINTLAHKDIAASFPFVSFFTDIKQQIDINDFYSNLISVIAPSEKEFEQWDIDILPLSNTSKWVSLSTHTDIYYATLHQIEGTDFYELRNFPICKKLKENELFKMVIHKDSNIRIELPYRPNLFDNYIYLQFAKLLIHRTKITL